MRGNAQKVKSFFLNRPKKRNLYNECLDRNIKMALFLWEPPSVIPDNYNSELHERFNYVFTWNDSYINKGSRYIKMFWPQTDKFPVPPKRKFINKKLLVNISGNKHSDHPRELYSERLKSIKHFEESHPESFDLYGFGWEIQKK